jgi:hypothetical protein
MQNQRTLFIHSCQERYPSGKLLRVALERCKDKEVSETHTYCTGFTNEKDSPFIAMVQYLVASIVAPPPTRGDAR